MTRLLDVLFDRLAIFLTATALTIALVAMAGQVFFRYFVGASLIWAEEVARYALVWSTMTGTAVAYRRGGHVAITDLVARLPRPGQALLRRLVHLLVLGFAVILAWQGWALAMRNFARHQLSPALQVDIAWIYLAIPFGAVLIVVAALEALLRGEGATRGSGAP
ncbi:MAG: TRAP transporter small permease [Alphaproteobacteria bacterium]|nr:TRAP transporter small permease [Alphaproteobacteria bacterium]